MSIIKIENLTFAYPGSADNVFEGLNLQLDSDWRLGFVGRNGRGKTTLLRLLTGEYEYSGKCSILGTWKPGSDQLQRRKKTGMRGRY